METLKKSRGNASNKKTVTETKNAFDELISRLDMSKERIKKLEYMSVETSQTEK